ncbi:Eco57I restriction-modification methylase domain-containing protein [Dolichospermum sp. ST_sed1]|nr:Eco57I restriction-modification methylase domain-containing protein [Dolichospermum sp. ST_sed1]MDD1424665.1 Eco57I restriction-modification methylase domain-containing protein [Dolichospermum sp. ST_sed9]MDD1430191.1 Eco57I restriction-modification methylase domain-containing protein [Dolichospermum sp. ST_sed6]MDD1437270.1 Eco57I restriction-modification methylase domain-containing protein [Dolichospermum sp. ST_sed10]MDD1439887.1 Eco57I restriction-modification methylase domain-containing
MQLTRFNEIDFLPALKEFFGKSNLNVPINYVDDKPVSAKKILQNTYKDNEAFRLINDVYFVGLVDDAAFRGNQSLAIDKIKSDYDGILIFGVTLNNRDHGQLPTRFLGRASLSHLAEISRAFNREFYYTPVVVVFKYTDANSEYLAFANTERLKYKDNREGEKAGKVTLLRDIDIRQPHSGHERILAELAIPTTGKDRVDSFAKLYAYWQKVLDVSLLNKQFYQEVSVWYFYACKQVVFPKDAKNNQESLIRLITRLMFVWFLKEKGLVPNQLFNQIDIKSILKSVEPQESTYYKAILQNLFFATLNTEGKRKFIKESSGGRNSQHMVHNVFRYKDYFQDPDGVIDRYFDDIPFLNGGLFECLDVPSQKDKPDTEKRIDGFSNHSSNVLSVPNELFFDGFQDVDLNADFGTSRKKYRVRGLLEIFKSYKFTIAENTPFEEDVALDPELLGQVFENLLAAYNPETQTTARKQTGSFYTPREIVNYMIDESLIAYFKEKLKSKQKKFTEQDFDKRLRLLLDYQSSVNSFEDDSDVTLALIESIDNCKILDPACGSGAFPMGILQKMVYVLSKLDHENLKWQELQRLKVQEETNQVFYIPDKDERQRRLIEINEAFDDKMNDPNYGRKLFLIENCIYGVDIQPIALQITKLRCFIALIVEQVVDRHKKNSGILPLPNLETKFVAANSLIRFSDQSLRSDEVIEKEQELKEIRKKHFTARSKATKDKYRERDEELRNEIRDLLKGIGLDAALADSLAQWNPYNQNASADFFDPEWMFGIKDGFDICIGNPPYVRMEQIKELKPVLQKQYECYTGRADLYVYFYERAYQLLREKGILTYISSNKYFRSAYGENLRQFLGKNTTINQLIDFGDAPIFTAIAYPSIIILSKEKPNIKARVEALAWQEGESLNNFINVFNNQKILLAQSELKADGWRLEDTKVLDLLAKLRSVGTPLDKYVNGKFYRGIVTGLNEAFVISKKQRDDFIVEDPKSLEVIKPFLRGKDVKRWSADFAERYIIFAKRGFQIDKYPSIRKYLERYRTELSARATIHTHPWYELQQPQEGIYQEFEKPKIVYQEIATHQAFAWDSQKLYTNNKIFFIPDSSYYLLAILNSKIVWFFLDHIVGKMAGGTYALQNIYVSQIPIRTATEAEQKAIETLVGYVIYLTTALKDILSSGDSSMDKLMTRYFEQIIDAAVMELYLPEELHEHDTYFMRHLLSENIQNIDTIKGDKIQTLREIFNRLFEKDHPIRVGIFFLDSIPIVRTIRGLK